MPFMLCLISFSAFSFIFKRTTQCAFKNTLIDQIKNKDTKSMNITEPGDTFVTMATLNLDRRL